MQRHVEPKRLICLEVGHQLELGGRLHREVGRLFASEDGNEGGVISSLKGRAIALTPKTVRLRHFARVA
jgi:hypothetical protein